MLLALLRAWSVSRRSPVDPACRAGARDPWSLRGHSDADLKEGETCERARLCQLEGNADLNPGPRRRSMHAGVPPPTPLTAEPLRAEVYLLGSEC